mmetsp:Transcript_48156/g.92049  ORF Transcript_48156/g.92049 Transcript_48156/m.92049 type:complete len:151 (-) Transcript_48156:399-851(-)
MWPTVKGIPWHRSAQKSKFLASERRRDPTALPAIQEQQRLACALHGGRAALLFFYHPQCAMCKSLHPLLMQAEETHSKWLHVTWLNTEAPEWIPEMIHYNINEAPTFVALVPTKGCSIGQSGPPLDRQHVVESMDYLIQALGSHCKVTHM